MSEVFIAFDASDRDRAEHLAAALRRHTYRAWWKFDFLPERIKGQALRAIADRTGATVMIWSSRVGVSDVMVDVASHAAAQSKLIAVRFEETRMPPAFASWPLLDLSRWDGSPDSPDLAVLLSQIEARALSFLPENEALRKARDRRLSQDLATFERALAKRADASWRSYLEREPDGIFAAVATGQLRAEVGAYVSPVELADEPGVESQWRTQETPLLERLAVIDLQRFARPALLAGGVFVLMAVLVTAVQMMDLKPRSEQAVASVSAPVPRAPPQNAAREDIRRDSEETQAALSSVGDRPAAPRARTNVQPSPPSPARVIEDAPTRSEPGARPSQPAPESTAPSPERTSAPQVAQIQAPAPAPPARGEAAALVASASPGAAFDIDALDRAARDAVQNARRSERRARAAAAEFRTHTLTVAGVSDFAYAGDVSRGAPQGAGEALWTSGARYSGAWRDGRQHGWGVLTYADGARYEGQFEAGRPTGNGVLWSQDGARLTGQALYATLLRRPG